MIKPNVKDGSFVKHTIGETLEKGWLVQIKNTDDFGKGELNGFCTGIVLGKLSMKDAGGAPRHEYWRLLLPNGKKPIVTASEVELIAG